MDALRIGIMTLFNAGGTFYNDIPGRLFFGDAPEGTNLSEGAYAIFFIVSDNPDDVFAKEGKEVYVQFSLFSGDSSPATILAMALHLEAMLKDKTFTVTGWTVQNTFLQQTSGPIYNSADVEAGTGFYWQTDIDYQVVLKKT
jgi:hypothetical protein